jgi:hypothetical protein
MQAQEIAGRIGAEVYAASVAEVAGATVFLARRGGDKLIGALGETGLEGDRIPLGQGGQGGRAVLGPLSRRNAEAVRRLLPWTAPALVGPRTSIGLGDRLGLATPGHVRAVRGSGLAAVFAQQSIRELARTRRSGEEVIDAATWGVLQEGYREGFGADADHLQEPRDIDVMAAAGFRLFTIDPGRHVVNEADRLGAPALRQRFETLDFETLQATPRDLGGRYAGRDFPLAGRGQGLRFTEESFLRAAVKYGGAVAHVVKMFRHLQAAAAREFEMEVSVDETDSPTSPEEHYFFASELRRLGVSLEAMAPRFVGRFEKGVDYIGDAEAFRRSFERHVAVMRTLGPYKISIHSGSDKFAIYPIVADLAGGHVHLKTAGTSYLEALRAVARIDAGLFREILDFARGHYEQDKATYHVSADAARVPPSSALSDPQLEGLLDDFHARQALHVTFGSVLTLDGGERFGGRIRRALQAHEEVYYDVLARHLGRHVRPFSPGRA